LRELAFLHKFNLIIYRLSCTNLIRAKHSYLSKRYNASFSFSLNNLLKQYAPTFSQIWLAWFAHFAIVKYGKYPFLTAKYQWNIVLAGAGILAQI